MNAHKVYVPTLLTLALLALAFTITLPAFAHHNEAQGSEAKHRTASSTMKVKKDRMATSTERMHKEKMGSSTEKMRKDKSATSTRNVDLTCMQTAVDARESALITAFTTYQTSTNEGLQVRKTALNVAWGLTDKTARVKAITDARKTWQENQVKAMKILKIQRKSAWETFKTTAKTSCKETLPKGDDAVEKDGAGAITI